MRLTVTLVSGALLAASVMGQNTCRKNGVAGICIPTGDCSSSGGLYESNLCPNDPPNVKCCTYGSCTISAANSRGGVCIPSASCTGSVFSGRCPGGSDILCCVTSGPYGHPGN